MLENDNNSVYERMTIGIYTEDKQYLEKNNLSASQILREYIKKHKQQDKKTNYQKKVDYIRERIVLVFIGVIGIFVGGFSSISFPYNLLFYVGGLIFIFYSIFGFLMKIMKTYYGRNVK